MPQLISNEHSKYEQYNNLTHSMLYLQGTFGKVYTAINNETGDIMAMKELPVGFQQARNIC